MGIIIHGDNLVALRKMASESVDLIYIDPPFNTGKKQIRTRLKTTRDDEGDRIGFKGLRYKTQTLSSTGYNDVFESSKAFLEFLKPRLIEAHRILKKNGSFFFHIDYREVHYCKILIDEIFGRESFMNEIIWAYDYGARSKTKWPAKHDNILWYAKDPENYTFNYEAMERIPYMAPGLVGEKKAALGKTPTDVWWHTIVSPNGKEKTGYATQKPLGILHRIINVHSNVGDVVMDFFAGSGSLGHSAAINGREWILMDANNEAINIIKNRLSPYTATMITAEAFDASSLHPASL